MTEARASCHIRRKANDDHGNTGRSGSRFLLTVRPVVRGPERLEASEAVTIVKNQLEGDSAVHASRQSMTARADLAHNGVGSDGERAPLRNVRSALPTVDAAPPPEWRWLRRDAAACQVAVQ